jgi:predicted nucleic acid-binding protein
VPARRIVDASPLILLSKAGRLEFLRVGADRVIVPDAVLDEIGRKGRGDPTFRAITSTDWLDILPAGDVPGPVAACRLGRGETAVLALAHGASDCEVVLDDLAARRAAASLGLPCLGSLGLVLLAKRQGVIPEARPTIEELRRVGLYLDDDFVAVVLKRIGE